MVSIARWSDYEIKKIRSSGRTLSVLNSEHVLIMSGFCSETQSHRQLLFEAKAEGLNSGPVLLSSGLFSGIKVYNLLPQAFNTDQTAHRIDSHAFTNTNMYKVLL